MKKEEWLEKFEEENGRKPTPEEFSKASDSGEFNFEDSDQQMSFKRKFLNKEVPNTIQEIKVGNSQELRSLKNEIQVLDQNLAQEFFELGMKVYQGNIQGKTIEVSNEIDSIIKLNIENYYKKQLFNEMVSDGKSCLSCGASIRETDRFCAICGNDVQAMENHEKNTRKSCNLCEIEQSGSNTFCVCCGKEFE